MTALTKPTIHLNGTSREALLEQYRDACDAVRTAMKAVADASPHGRDYYPQGKEAINKAIDEHVDRLRRLEGVLSELVQIGSDLA